LPFPIIEDSLFITENNLSSLDEDVGFLVC